MCVNRVDKCDKGSKSTLPVCYERTWLGKGSSVIYTEAHPCYRACMLGNSWA